MRPVKRWWSDSRLTVRSIFNAEKFKRLQDPLDPFAVEFMLSSATYLWNCTYTVKKLWITTLYLGYPVWVRTFIDNCKPPAKSQHNGPLRPSKIVFVLIIILRHYLPKDFLTEHWGFILVCYKTIRTPYLGQLVVLRSRLSRWVNNKKWYTIIRVV